MDFRLLDIHFKPRIFEGYRIPGDPRLYPEPHLLFPDLRDQCDALGLTFYLRIRARNYLYDHAHQQGRIALSQFWFFAIEPGERMLFATARDCKLQILPDDAIE